MLTVRSGTLAAAAPLTKKTTSTDFDTVLDQARGQRRAEGQGRGGPDATGAGEPGFASLARRWVGPFAGAKFCTVFIRPTWEKVCGKLPS
jgi:hypothetical protein